MIGLQERGREGIGEFIREDEGFAAAELEGVGQR